MIVLIWSDSAEAVFTTVIRDNGMTLRAGLFPSSGCSMAGIVIPTSIQNCDYYLLNNSRRAVGWITEHQAVSINHLDHECHWVIYSWFQVLNPVVFQSMFIGLGSRKFCWSSKQGRIETQSLELHLLTVLLENIADREVEDLTLTRSCQFTGLDAQTYTFFIGTCAGDVLSSGVMGGDAN